MVDLEAGRGSISFKRHGVEPFAGRTDPAYVKMLQMYPKSVGIYFARTAGGAATPADPIPMFGGIIETFEGRSDGMVKLGFNEIQSYLDRLMIRSDLVFSTLYPNVMSASLVNH